MGHWGHETKLDRRPSHPDHRIKTVVFQVELRWHAHVFHGTQQCAAVSIFICPHGATRVEDWQMNHLDVALQLSPTRVGGLSQSTSVV
jgi:hypothetical protein